MVVVESELGTELGRATDVEIIERLVALDGCDIADGSSLDVDGNCIPDECDQDPTPMAPPRNAHASA